MRTSTGRILAGVGTLAVLAGALGSTTEASAATVPSVLLKIRYCESGNNYASKAASGTAGGAYGFLDSTWRASTVAATKSYAHAWLAPASVQDAAAIALYNQLGTKPWVASQHCWANLTSVPTTTSSSSSTTSTSTTSTVSGSVSSAATSSTAAKPKPKPGKKPAPAGCTALPPKGKPVNAMPKGPAPAPKGAPKPAKALKPAPPKPAATADRPAPPKPCTTAAKS